VTDTSGESSDNGLRKSVEGIYEWLTDEPMLHEPILVVMLTGWIDAAGAGAAAAAALSAECETSPILRFDDDTFIDYRARRPTMELRDGLNTDLVWATIELRAGRSPSGRDILVLTGPEPDMAWRRFAHAMADISEELGVTQMVAFGAYPFAAPHTRPARLSCSSPSTEVLANVTFARSSVDVPAGMAAALEHALHARKIPTLGLWVQVPHYVAAMAYPASSVALLDGFAEVTGITLAADGLRAEVKSQRQRIDESISGSAERESMLHQLEEIYDAAIEGEVTSGPELEMQSGDELADEIQRFLRDQD
jgi:hypothetical protein